MARETKGLARYHREGTAAGTRRSRLKMRSGSSSGAVLVKEPPVEICDCGWPKGGEGCQMFHEAMVNTCPKCKSERVAIDTLPLNDDPIILACRECGHVFERYE